MKLITLSAIALLMLGLNGCATTGHSVGMTSSYDEDIDYVKMDVITRDARARGYDIVWIHPPQKDKATRSGMNK